MNPLYLFVSGILLGAGVGGHVLRLVVMAEDPRAWAVRSRIFVAWAGVAFYGLGSFLCFFGNWGGPLIAVVFPIIGVSVVLAAKQRIDRFQIALGAFQLVALVVSVYLLLLGSTATREPDLFAW